MRKRTWLRRVRWGPLLWATPTIAVGTFLVVSCAYPSFPQINQLEPTPSSWHVLVEPNCLRVYHFGAAVPDSVHPFFVNPGWWSRGTLVLGEQTVYPRVGSSTLSGFVHPGGRLGRWRRSGCGPRRSTCRW